ncbi:MAG: FAD-dependent monooxygenase, partial [Gammaproteobacteria bacterium]|nr:FAD-dependent monooxygenase [Gammaproteobacteria bacterium]
AEYLHVHRADLHQALLEGVRRIDADAVSLGDEFLALEENTPARVRARFTRSGSLEADVLLGADGLRSELRVALFGPEAPAFAGYVAYRGLVPVEALAPSLLEHASCMSLGPRNLFLRYLVSASTLLNVVCIGRSDDWAQESWSVPATREELLGLLQGWHEDVLEVASKIPADSLFKWGVFDRSALSHWTSGRVALLGDAAHPMQPFLGQGAVMALEDAAILARVLAPGQDISSALACYERVRLPRANEVMTQSADNGRRLVPRSDSDYRPGSHTSPASLGLMRYNPVTVPLQ